MNSKDLKIAITGPENSGKTFLFNSIAGRSINEEITVTIGVDLIIKKIISDEILYRLYLWDIGAPYISHHLNYCHLNYCQIIILCIDSTDPNSPLKVKKSYEDMKCKKIVPCKNIIIVLTKIDSAIPQVINKSKKLAKELGHRLIQTSTVNKQGIDKLIKIICAHNNTGVYKKTFKHYYPHPRYRRHHC
jgi:small GTP-binding protein